MPGVCYDPYGCEWTIGYLWRSMDSFIRLDIIALALMFACTVVIGGVGSYRYRLLRRQFRLLTPGTGNPNAIDTDNRMSRRGRISVSSDLRLAIRILRSIAHIAPFLGLTGTCLGILTSFRGIGMEKYAALAMMTSDLAHSLIATAMAILVTIAAICSQTYLVSLLDALDAERSKARAEIGRSLQKFPLKLPFSNLPSFGLISAPTMAILLTTFLVLPSAFSVSKGVDVSLLKYGTQFMQSRSSTEPLVIGIDIGPNGSLIAYVNSKKTPWNKLGDSITSVLKSRPHELAYVGARGDVTWADVVSAIGVLREHDAKVVLLTSPAAAPTTALSARSGK